MPLSLSQTRSRASRSRMYSDLDRRTLAVRVGLKGDDRAIASAAATERGEEAATRVHTNAFEGLGSFSG